jgi:hypothetical protein
MLLDEGLEMLLDEMVSSDSDELSPGSLVFVQATRKTAARERAFFFKEIGIGNLLKGMAYSFMSYKIYNISML